MKNRYALKICIMFFALSAIITDTYGFASWRRALVSMASQARRGLCMAAKRPCTRIGAATLLSAGITVQQSHASLGQPGTDEIVAMTPLVSPKSNTKQPLTDRIMNSLWENVPSSYEKNSDAAQTSALYNAPHASHVTMRLRKGIGEGIVIESEASKEVSVKEFLQKKLPATVAVSTLPFAAFAFDFAHAPRLRGTFSRFEFSDSHTKCKGTLHFPETTPDDLSVKASVRCTTELSREEYFGYLLREDEQGR